MDFGVRRFLIAGFHSSASVMALYGATSLRKLVNDTESDYIYFTGNAHEIFIVERVGIERVNLTVTVN